MKTYRVFFYVEGRYSVEVEAENVTEALSKAEEASLPMCDEEGCEDRNDYEVRDEKGKVLYADEEFQDEDE